MLRWPNLKNASRSRLKAARLAAARARHKPSDEKRSAWEVAGSYWNRFTTVVLNGLAVLTFGFALYIVWETVTQKVITVAPIAVPKALADRGYTSDVAAQRLQSAIKDIVEVGHLIKAGPNIAQQAELPSIVVPSTGWSIDAIASYIRSFFRVESRWNVSGDVTIVDQKLWLHLRMNGRDLYATAAGVDPEHPDDLFGLAAQMVIGRTDPYILAASISRTDLSRSLEIAHRIISGWPATDPSVAWAHTLIGNTLYDQNKKDDAIAEYRKAIELQPNFGLAHTNLGLALNAQNKSKEAIAECRRGIDLDPRSPSAHAAMCNILGAMHKSDAAKTECDTAITDYRKIIETDPYEATPHVKLGLLLRRLGRAAEAIEEFRTALDIAPHDVLTHIDLGLVLLEQGKTNDAVIEFQKAIEINPRLASAHRSLSEALRQQGNTDAANDELKRAITLETNHESKLQPTRPEIARV